MPESDWQPLPARAQTLFVLSGVFGFLIPALVGLHSDRIVRQTRCAGLGVRRAATARPRRVRRVAGAQAVSPYAVEARRHRLLAAARAPVAVGNLRAGLARAAPGPQARAARTPLPPGDAGDPHRRHARQRGQRVRPRRRRCRTAARPPRPPTRRRRRTERDDRRTRSRRRAQTGACIRCRGCSCCCSSSSSSSCR